MDRNLRTELGVGNDKYAILRAEIKWMVNAMDSEMDGEMNGEIGGPNWI